jgi:O-antigen biosynthesis protein WbqP
MPGELHMKRVFDFLLALVASIVLFLPMLVIAVMIKVSSKGPVLFWSDRVGINNVIFKMPKFRTMYDNTPDIATHLLKNADLYLTPVGPYLRKYSLDELPQLWSILKGDMSFVGPRPALHNQEDLIAIRTARGINHLIPGITGWAQINGRDEISIPVKVLYDEYYLRHHSFFFDLRILWMTFSKVIRSEDIQH